MKKNGFTLVELLVVIIIIGILLTMAIPTVSNLIGNRSNKKFETYLTIVEEATNLYVRHHRGEFLIVDNECINIDYQKIIEYEEVKEDNISCTGNIILTKEKNNNFSNEYYLTCTDGSDNTYRTTTKSLPSGCSIK